MSTTRGEQKQSIRSTVIGGAIAMIAAAGLIVGVSVSLDHARAEAAQLHLLKMAKTSSITMEAATAEDAALSASTVQAAAIVHTDQIAAAEQAAYDAKIAAQKAAAAKAAAAAQAAALAAQQAAQQAPVQQSAPVQQASAPSAPSSAGLPPGSPVPWIPSSDPNNSAGGSWDTQACASHNASGNPAVCD